MNLDDITARRHRAMYVENSNAGADVFNLIHNDVPALTARIAALEAEVAQLRADKVEAGRLSGELIVRGAAAEQERDALRAAAKRYLDAVNLYSLDQGGVLAEDPGDTLTPLLDAESALKALLT